MTGPSLTQAMQRGGWTVESLAAHLRVSTDTVSSWRQDRRKPCCYLMVAALEEALEREGKTECDPDCYCECHGPSP